MASPENVKATAVLGSAHGTNGVVLLSTPVSVWGLQVFNGMSTVQTGGFAETTNGILSLPFAAGATDLATHGYRMASLAGRVDHTNMTMLVYYTPYQS